MRFFYNYITLRISKGAKNNAKAICCSLIWITVGLAANAQEFSFPLYFEDALGNRDTLILGYDPMATDTIDEAFGEQDIRAIPFDATFEVRVADLGYADGGRLMEDPTSFHSKTQIKMKECDSSYFPLVSSIIISNAEFPLTVSWDSALFMGPCNEQSLITDWRPGGWFDAAYGTEQYPVYFNRTDTAVFTHTTHTYVNDAKDTLNLLFLTLASENHTIAGITEATEDNKILLAPNPAETSIRVVAANKSIKKIMFYDALGNCIEPAYKNGLIQLTNLKLGTYVARILLEDDTVVMRRFIKI